MAAGDWIKFIPPVRLKADFAGTRARVLSVRVHSPVRHCLVAAAPVAPVCASQALCDGCIVVDVLPRPTSLSGWDRVLGEAWPKPCNFEYVLLLT